MLNITPDSAKLSFTSTLLKNTVTLAGNFTVPWALQCSVMDTFGFFMHMKDEHSSGSIGLTSLWG
jgi:hypothetical protein